MCTQTAEELKQKLLEKGWDCSRELVRHENELANHRIVAFLSIQAFLFAAFFVGVSAFANESNRDFRPHIWVLLTLVSAAGYRCSWLIEPVLRAAFRHVHATLEWWQRFSTDETYRKEVPFPVLIGRTARHRRFFLGLFGAYFRTEDEPYPELRLTPEAEARINVEAVAGIPRLPGFMLVVWALLFLLSLGVGAWQLWSAAVPASAATVTKIKIVEDSRGHPV
jgi:hypothetical protein